VALNACLNQTQPFAVDLSPLLNKFVSCLGVHTDIVITSDSYPFQLVALPTCVHVMYMMCTLHACVMYMYRDRKQEMPGLARVSVGVKH
jgi:hypothetical protein